LTPGGTRSKGVGSCNLRDTFFGHPESVDPGPLKILAHRAQVGGDVRRPSRHAKPATTKTTARTPAPRQPALTAGRTRSKGVASCNLRDTFLGHPESVDPGPSKILAHRAQVGGDVRRPSRHAKPAATKTPARTPAPRQPALTPGRTRSKGVASCNLRDTFLGHPESVDPGPSKILAHRAQVPRGLRPTPCPAKPAATKTPATTSGSKRSAASPEGGPKQRPQAYPHPYSHPGRHTPAVTPLTCDCSRNIL